MKKSKQTQQKKYQFSTKIDYENEIKKMISDMRESADTEVEEKYEKFMEEYVSFLSEEKRK